MNEKPSYRQAAAIIAQRSDGRFLLVRKPRTHHAWQFPQGGVEAGESFSEAARREFCEEIGTDQVKILGEEQGIFQYDFPPDAEFPNYISVENRDKYRGQEVHIFLAEFSGADTDIQLEKKELAEYRWVTAVELSDLIENSNYLKICQEIITKC